MKHILVTGGNGFIGRYVVEELQSRGYMVDVFDRHTSNNSIPQTQKWASGSYFGDIKDATLVTDAISHVDGVIHLAGVLGTQETIANPVPAAETNILGGLNVINACAQYDVPLINIAVGNYWMQNTYSITKNTIERFIEMKVKYEGKAFSSVRALNAYGPRQVPVAPWGSSRVRKIMPSFICRALSGEPIEIYGDGEQIMDMIYVTDVAYILVSALEHLDASGPTERTIEAGTGRDTTVNDIAAAVNVSALDIADIGVPIRHLSMRPGEDPNSVVKADTSTLLQLDLDAGDFTTLEAGVHETVRYFKDYLAE
jgi:UDP-glucose 4-epimerase